MIFRRMVRPGANRRLVLERLDARLPMAATAASSSLLRTLPALYGPAVTAPASTSTSIAAAAPAAASISIAAATPFPFSSLPSAANTLYLDFNGHYQPAWGSYTPNATPAYDLDGNQSWFNDLEQRNIESIARQVAEDYSPFQINVTTVEPAAFGPTVMRIAIGGNSNWVGPDIGGAAFLGSFGTNNTAYVFPRNLLSPKDIGDAISHEAGHTFGLEHQSTWSGTTRVQEYSTGTPSSAPIMGLPYQSQRSQWWAGLNANGQYQDDTILLRNRLGLRPDDYLLTATTPLNIVGNGFADKPGIIESVYDVDQFTLFVTSTGVREFSLNLPSPGNLVPRLQLKSLSGSLLATATSSPSNNGSLWLSYNFGATGNYYLEVSSQSPSLGVAVVGEIGQYTLSSKQDSDYLIGLAGAGWWGTGLNTGQTKLLSTWSTAVTWNNPVTGDFNGDGATDFAAQANGVQWWYGLSGPSNTFSVVAGTVWPAGTRLIGARDVNGDNRLDIVGFAPNNQIITAVSTASTPFNSTSSPWSSAVTWGDFVLGDFNADGLADFGARVQNGGNWWITTGNAISNLAGTPSHWGIFPTGTYREMTVVDYNGDGRDDILGRMSTGVWQFGTSTATSFSVSTLQITGSGNWTNVMVGNLHPTSLVSVNRPLVTNEIIARDTLGNWQLVSFGSAGGFTFTEVRNVGSWGSDQYSNLMIRDVDRDGVAELIGRQSSGAQAGTWRFDRLTGGALVRDTRSIRNPGWANITWFADIAYDDGDIF